MKNQVMTYLNQNYLHSVGSFNANRNRVNGDLQKNGDPKPGKGPHGDPGHQMGTHLATVVIRPHND